MSRDSSRGIVDAEDGSVSSSSLSEEGRVVEPPFVTVVDSGVDSPGSQFVGSGSSSDDARSSPESLSGAAEGSPKAPIVNNSKRLDYFAKIFRSPKFNPNKAGFLKIINILMTIRDDQGRDLLYYSVKNNNKKLSRFLYENFADAKSKFKEIIFDLIDEGDYDAIISYAAILPQGFVASQLYQPSRSKVDSIRSKYKSFLASYENYSDYFSGIGIEYADDFIFGEVVRSADNPLVTARLIIALKNAGLSPDQIKDSFGCSGSFYAADIGQLAIMSLNGISLSMKNCVDETFLDTLIKEIRAIDYNSYYQYGQEGSELESRKSDLSFLLVTSFLFGDFKWQDFSDLKDRYQLNLTEMFLLFFRELGKSSKDYDLLKALNSEKLRSCMDVQGLDARELSVFFVEDGNGDSLLECDSVFISLLKEVRLAYGAEELLSIFQGSLFLHKIASSFIEADDDKIAIVSRNVAMILDRLIDNTSIASNLEFNDPSRETVFSYLFQIKDAQKIDRRNIFMKEMIMRNIMPSKEELPLVISLLEGDKDQEDIIRKLLFSGLYDLDKMLIRGEYSEHRDFVTSFVNRELAEISSFADLVSFQDLFVKTTSSYEIDNALIKAKLGQKVDGLIRNGVAPQSKSELQFGILIINSCYDITHNSSIYDEDYNIITGATSVFHDQDYSASHEYISLMEGRDFFERKMIADRFSLYRKVDEMLLKDIKCQELLSDLILKTRSSFDFLNYNRFYNSDYIDDIRRLVSSRFPEVAGSSVFDCLDLEGLDANFCMTFINECATKKVFPDSEERFQILFSILSGAWSISQFNSPESLFAKKVILKDDVEDLLVTFQGGCMDSVGAMVYDLMPIPNDSVFSFRLIKKLCATGLFPDSQERFDIALEYLNHFCDVIEGDEDNKDLLQNEAIELATLIIEKTGFKIDFSLISQEGRFVSQIAKKIGNSDFISSSRDIEANPMKHRRFSVDSSARLDIDQIRKKSQKEAQKVVKFPDAKSLSKQGKGHGAAMSILLASLLLGL